MDAVEDVCDGVVDGVLARLDRQALMPHVLQCDDLGAHLVLRELFAGDVLVFEVIGAVDAAVDAVVGKIQRCEHHDAVAVERQLDLVGELVHLLDLVGEVAGEQHRRLAVVKPRADDAIAAFARARLVENRVDQFDVALVGFGIGDGVQDLLIVDEFLRLEGFGVIDRHVFCSFLAGQIALSGQRGFFYGQPAVSFAFRTFFVYSSSNTFE